MNSTEAYQLNATEEFLPTNATEIDIPLLAQSHYYFKAGLIVNNYYGLSGWNWIYWKHHQFVGYAAGE